MTTNRKLTNLITSWSHGSVYTCSWLNKHGYTYDLIRHYKKIGWLNAVGNGAVVRKGDKVDWTGGICAIQNQLDLKIHVGGKTALALKGNIHFVPLGKETITLFGSLNTKLPTWFKNYNWDKNIEYTISNLFKSEKEFGLEKYSIGAFSINISSRERAILELLDLVPNQQSFEEGILLMESLLTLRPNVLQKLLECCTSIKVKRLFLSIAEKLELPCVKRLKTDKINFGKGKRFLVKNGKLHPKYLITVPSNFFDKE